jgi:hypothetical protein
MIGLCGCAASFLAGDGFCHPDSRSFALVVNCTNIIIIDPVIIIQQGVQVGPYLYGVLLLVLALLVQSNGTNIKINLPDKSNPNLKQNNDVG